MQAQLFFSHLSEISHDRNGEYKINLRQEKPDTFLDKWYIQPIRNEIEFVFSEIKKIQNINSKKVISIIFSRAIRSCRATTHADLATLKDPITATYYCAKHGKVCKPLFSILKWWESYSKDTIKRLVYFDKLRTNTQRACLNRGVPFRYRFGSGFPLILLISLWGIRFNPSCKYFIFVPLWKIKITMRFCF